MQIIEYLINLKYLISIPQVNIKFLKCYIFNTKANICNQHLKKLFI